MTRSLIRVVDVYPYRRQGSLVEFLLLKRAEGNVYQGQWRMVAGKMRPGEKAWEAALRELREETGLSPQRFWAVPTLNVFYEWEHDRVNLIPVFAAEVAPGARPRLNDEHERYGWFRAETISSHVHWPEHHRIITLIQDMLHAGRIPPELEIPVKPA